MGLEFNNKGIGTIIKIKKLKNMKTTNFGLLKVPTAYLAVNNSRLKIYNKNSEIPTYYLEGGQEFQIELFNPTQKTVLAKIILNGKTISQGGLVLRPGVRVFLDRYIDVAKKFLFDTYEVSGTNEEVKEAIAKNGDIKIQFFNEYEIKPSLPISMPRTIFGGPYYNQIGLNTNDQYAYYSSTGDFGGSNNASFTTTSFTSNDTLGLSNNVKSSPLRSLAKSKSIETGRVEQGSQSDQKFKSVDLNFEPFSFHTIEYKMLPISQKVNEVGEIYIKRYCTNCGSKLSKGDKFCSNCGHKS
jgi:hypothetical protein